MRPLSSMGRNELLAELTERRRQPVLPTCGDCGWRRGASYSECQHPDATGPVHVTDRDLPPPDWCPFRGAP